MEAHFAQTIEWVTDAGHLPGVAQTQKYMGYMLSEAGEGTKVFADPELQQIAYDLERISLRLRALEFNSDFENMSEGDRVMLLDSAVDTIWTAIGLGHMLADIDGAYKELVRSNNSKRINGKLIVDSTGKVLKGPDYTPPNLVRFLR